MAAPGKHTHHALVELDTNVDEVGAANGVDPEGTSDLAFQLVGECRVEQIEEWFGASLGQLIAWREANAQAEILFRERRQGVAVLGFGKLLMHVDEQGDVLHGHRRQTMGHRLPMPLKEHEGHHRLEQHHGGDDDDQRARIEALRHLVAERGEQPSRRPEATG